MQVVIKVFRDCFSLFLHITVYFFVVARYFTGKVRKVNAHTHSQNYDIEHDDVFKIINAGVFGDAGAKLCS